MNPHDQAKQINKDHHYFTTLTPDVDSADKGEIDDLTISFKDNIVTEDVETTAGSAILDGHTPTFDATVVTRVKQAGADIIGKTTMDEFGFGSFNLNTPHTPPRHPDDDERVTGGSSGGAAGITATMNDHVAIAESTGGSIVNPAAFCGVPGFCPTYGLVSRHGLISYANSLDKIGTIADTTDNARRVFNTIRGYDERDATTLDEEPDTDEVEHIGILPFNADDDVTTAFNNAVNTLSHDYTVEHVETPFTQEYALPAYYIISMSEASTNLARYTGLRYGPTGDPRGKHFTRYYTEMRNVFTDEAKRRIHLGTYMRMEGYRDKYYTRALKARTKVINEYKQLFNEYDILITPTMPMTAPTRDEARNLSPVETYEMDQLTVGPNLAGLPHGTIPIGDDLPKGLLIITDHLNDGTVLDFMQRHEGRL